MRRPGLFAVAALATVAAVAGPVASASAEEASTASGHDVSFPQCGRPLPAREHIAVVGVNAGTGTTTNPCLAEQLAWADGPGPDGIPRLADVYVNTANPGHVAGWWPAADLTREGLPLPNPYGACRGAEDAACAYVYGWSTAVDDAFHRGVSLPADRTWWLDVETVNTWSWDRAANRAVLEGMTDALRRTGASVGLYSTVRQWRLIVGTTPASSALAGLPAWLSGAVTRSGAEANCATAPLTPGGSVRMVQWVPGPIDRDIACAPGITGSRPTLAGRAEVDGLLTVQPGPWRPRSAALRIQWLRDGLPIAGAEGVDYRPTAADAGASLSVRVTGRTGTAPDLVLDSAAVLIPVPAPVGGPVLMRGALPGI